MTALSPGAADRLRVAQAALAAAQAAYAHAVVGDGLVALIDERIESALDAQRRESLDLYRTGRVGLVLSEISARLDMIVSADEASSAGDDASDGQS